MALSTAGKALINNSKRVDFDFYPTPLFRCHDALSFLPAHLQPQCILDAGAGTGVWGKAARKKYPRALITGVDIRPETVQPKAYNFWLRNDFLLLNEPPCFDLVMSNPPYEYAEAFVRQSMAMLETSGFCIMLLRLNFLETQPRARLFNQYPLQKVVVCASRISFTNNSLTNATAYAYFIWQKGYKGATALEWSLQK